jgi:hypothetical protein
MTFFKTITHSDSYDVILIPLKSKSNIGIIIINDINLKKHSKQINDTINTLNCNSVKIICKIYQHCVFLGPKFYTISNTIDDLSTIITDWNDTNIELKIFEDIFEIASKTLLNKENIDTVFIFGYKNSIYHNSVINKEIKKNTVYIAIDNDITFYIYLNGSLIMKTDSSFLNKKSLIWSKINLNNFYQNSIKFNKSIIDIKKYDYTVDDINNTTYLPFMIIDKASEYYYDILETKLDNTIVKINDIYSNSDIYNYSILNMLNNMPIEYIKLNIDKIKKNISSEWQNKTSYDILKNTFNTILINIKDSLIKDIPVKNNFIELLKLFAINNQFKFSNINKFIKQNNNIINNISTINKFNDSIIKWNESFTNFNINDGEFNESCDQYNLIISRTSWYEELENKNIIGLIIRIITPKLSKLGITMNRTEVLNVYNNLISLEQLCEAQHIFNNDNNNFDNGRNSEKMAISGNALGFGNGILPLYINKLHWDLVKTQLNYSMGIIINQNPFDYYYKQYDIYPMTLLTFLENIISDKSNINDKNIIMFIQLIITNSVLFKDFYKFKINGMNFDKLNNILSTSTNNSPANITEKTIDNLDCVLGFSILTNNHHISNQIHTIKKSIKIILKEVIRKTFKKCFNDIPIFSTDVNTVKIAEATFKIDLEKYSNNKDICDYIIANYLKYTYIKNNSTEEFLTDSININNYLNNLDGLDIKNKPLSKLISWYLINDMNNETTVKYINQVLNSKYGTISNECISYFKEKLLAINSKYVNLNSENILSFLSEDTPSLNDNLKLRYLGLYYQCAYSRNYKYMDIFNKFDPLEEVINTEEIVKHCNFSSYSDIFYLDLKYINLSLEDKREFLINVFKFILEHFDKEITKDIIKAILHNVKNYNGEFKYITEVCQQFFSDKIYEYVLE